MTIYGRDNLARSRITILLRYRGILLKSYGPGQRAHLVARRAKWIEVRSGSLCDIAVRRYDVRFTLIVLQNYFEP